MVDIDRRGPRITEDDLNAFFFPAFNEDLRAAKGWHNKTKKSINRVNRRARG
jgi:hypothetical protein